MKTYADGTVVGGSVLDGQGVLGVFGSLALGTYQENKCMPPTQVVGVGWYDREGCS